MQCNTVGQMMWIARAGAMKMPEQGYTVTKTDWGGGKVWEVTKADGTSYHVDLSIGENGWCPCPFHVDNRHLAPQTCCKHCLAAKWAAEAEENRRIHAEMREIVRKGGGLGIPQVIGVESAGDDIPHTVHVLADGKPATVRFAVEGSRIAKMFAHPADDIEARIF